MSPKGIDAELLAYAVECVNDGVVITDARLPDTPTIYVNPAFEELTSYCAKEILNKNCRFLQGEDNDQPGLKVLRQAISSAKPCRVDLRNYRKDGTLFWNELSLSPLFDKAGELTHFIGIQKDITRRKQLEEQLMVEVETDELTGLYNRRGLYRYWKEKASLSRRAEDEIALAVIDIDNLKGINDQFGHVKGDEALVAVASVLKDSHRKPDLVARVGGDEFAMLLVGALDIDIKEYEERMQKKLNEKLEVLNFPFELAVSTGCALYLDTMERSFNQLVIEADTRMYKVKGAKKGDS